MRIFDVANRGALPRLAGTLALLFLGGNALAETPDLRLHPADLMPLRQSDAAGLFAARTAPFGGNSAETDSNIFARQAGSAAGSLRFDSSEYLVDEQALIPTTAKVRSRRQALRELVLQKIAERSVIGGRVVDLLWKGSDTGIHLKVAPADRKVMLEFKARF